MIMIETVEGVKHINEILDVPGIGSIFIGTSDLGMGPATPLPPPEAEAEIAKVLSACKAKKVICSFPAIGGPGEAKQRLDAGFRMLLVSGGAAAIALRDRSPGQPDQGTIFICVTRLSMALPA